MGTLHFWVLISLAISFPLFHFLFRKKPVALDRSVESADAPGKFTLPLLFLLALALRMVLAISYQGFDTDINCFAAWSLRMEDVGPRGFYSKDYFSDYPPLYLYYLWFCGWITKVFSIPYLSVTQLVLLKLPSILSDLGIGFLLYKTCTRKLDPSKGLALASLYLFQPVVLMNSCLWGQVDSLFTFLLLLLCLLLERNKLLPAYLIFAAGVLLKPQMLIFSPLILLSALEYLWTDKLCSKRALNLLGFGLPGILLLIVLTAPFGFDKVVSQYTDTLASYPYASVNAYNFWALMGKNWHLQTEHFLGLPCSVWGNLVIVCITLISLFLGLRIRKTQGKYSLIGALLILTVFTFSVRMHERYLYPVIALLLLSLPDLCMRFKGFFRSEKAPSASLSPGAFFTVLFLGITTLHFYNTGHILFFYDPTNYSPNAPVLRLTSLGITLCALLFYFFLFLLLGKGKEKNASAHDAVMRKPGKHRTPWVSVQNDPSFFGKLTGRDLLLLTAITILYSAFALYDLGDTKAPTTPYSMEAGDSILLDFGDRKASSFDYYIAPQHDRMFYLTVSDSLTDPLLDTFYDITLSNVFTWQSIELPYEGRFVSLSSAMGENSVIELVFRDADGQKLMPVNADQYPELFDENALGPDRPSFRNGMYFDEIYHGRTAYEFLNGLRTYETTHPPLGKILISLGVSIFGMNPFGWRITGTLFGILMLPMIYAFAKKILGNSAFAVFVCWIFAFDFMHFAQTRIATIDVYIVFFIIAMYYFLYCYLSRDYMASSMKSLLLPLAFCGISMGFGVASKWTGVYAGAGMGVLFFLSLFSAYRKLPCEKTVTSRGKERMSPPQKAFWERTLRIVLWCLLFFVVTPCVIYLLSYLPFRDYQDSSLLNRMLENQEAMFSYHKDLEATHYFASPYYEWPLVVRPIWYYSGKLAGDLREGISSFGNPLVWWAGIPAFLYMIYLYIKKKDSAALFLIIGYASQYLPWFLVSRITFIYHYFPCVVFVVLMIGYALRDLLMNASAGKIYLLLGIYGALVFLLFLMFYPVLSGQPVEISYVKNFLRWFDTWILISG